MTRNVGRSLLSRYLRNSVSDSLTKRRKFSDVHSRDKTKMNSKPSSVKCIRDIRDVPPAAYCLPNDGRQQRHLCEQRQRLAWLLATYADGDGSRIRPSVQTLADRLGKSRRAVTYLLDDLEKLGLLENGTLTGFKGTRWRTLKLDAFASRSVAQSSGNSCAIFPLPVAQSTADSCAIYAPPVAQSTQDCVAETPKIAHNRPSDRPKEQTDIANRPASQTDSENGGQAAGTENRFSLSTKKPWQQFIQKAQEMQLCEEMLFATPKPEEIETVLTRLELLDGDIEELVDDINEWAEVQSPPLNTLMYGRWTRWLEQTAHRF